MPGKWAEGIEPRNFRWVIKDRLAICERPGGYGQNHRRVRRQEEIIWIKRQGFTRIVSLSPAPYNLHNYEEMEVDYLHWPLADNDNPRSRLPEIYSELGETLEQGEQLVLHREEVGDRLAGLVGGYLVWAGLVDHPAGAITVTERLTGRPLGSVGRSLVTVGADLAEKRSA